MGLTDPTQVHVGNTLTVDDTDVVVRATITTDQGPVLVVGTKGHLGGFLVFPGDLLDSPDVEHAAYPPAPNGSQVSAEDVAQDAKIANLERTVQELTQRERERQAVAAPDTTGAPDTTVPADPVPVDSAPVDPAPADNLPSTPFPTP